MLPVANHLPLRLDNPRQRVRSRIRRALTAPAVRDFVGGLLSVLAISALIIALSIGLVVLVCTL